MTKKSQLTSDYLSTKELYNAVLESTALLSIPKKDMYLQVPLNPDEMKEGSEYDVHTYTVTLFAFSKLGKIFETPLKITKSVQTHLSQHLDLALNLYRELLPEDEVDLFDRTVLSDSNYLNYQFMGVEQYRGTWYIPLEFMVVAYPDAFAKALQDFEDETAESRDSFCPLIPGPCKSNCVYTGCGFLKGIFYQE
jgi:hypothetical protein